MTGPIPGPFIQGQPWVSRGGCRGLAKREIAAGCCRIGAEGSWRNWVRRAAGVGEGIPAQIWGRANGSVRYQEILQGRFQQ